MSLVRRLGMALLAAALVSLIAPSVRADRARVYFDCGKERRNAMVCLACNIYHEARNQSDPGQLSVAMVVLNRRMTPGYPQDICEVVWDIRKDARTGEPVAHFSWTNDTLPDAVTEPRAWQRAWTLARLALLSHYGRAPHLADPTHGALNYHSVNVSPYWRDGLEPTVRIGDHLFYRPRAKPEIAVAGR